MVANRFRESLTHLHSHKCVGQQLSMLPEIHNRQEATQTLQSSIDFLTECFRETFGHEKQPNKLGELFLKDEKKNKLLMLTLALGMNPAKLQEQKHFFQKVMETLAIEALKDQLSPELRKKLDHNIKNRVQEIKEIEEKNSQLKDLMQILIPFLVKPEMKEKNMEDKEVKQTASPGFNPEINAAEKILKQNMVEETGRSPDPGETFQVHGGITMAPGHADPFLDVVENPGLSDRLVKEYSPELRMKEELANPGDAVDKPAEIEEENKKEESKANWPPRPKFPGTPPY